MSEYGAKNYTEQGGERSVIGGEIVIEGKMTVEEGAEVSGLPEQTLVVLPVAANQAASTASDVAGIVTDFNALLDKLKTSGLMQADELVQTDNSETVGE